MAAPRVRVPGLAIAALAVLVVGVFTIAPTLSTYLSQQQKVRDAQALVAQQRADLDDLAAQRARWDDPAYVRAQAGARLYYVMPGTTAYRVIHASPAAPAADETARSTAWPEVLARSLTAAGTTDEPAEPGR
ncbi:septum formation initiator family protein [Amnibacterium endophyticum]|uniref:Septum formation initiator family protein n=1 Tax=Amnibacterium endophyticum TaxID=2109337 RepID=A0ABW4LAX1_9MICO